MCFLSALLSLHIVEELMTTKRGQQNALQAAITIRLAAAFAISQQLIVAVGSWVEERRSEGQAVWAGWKIWSCWQEGSLHLQGSTLWQAILLLYISCSVISVTLKCPFSPLPWILLPWCKFCHSCSHMSWKSANFSWTKRCNVTQLTYQKC